MKIIDHPQKPKITELMADVRIKFDAALLLQVAPFMAQNDIRYYLNGVRIEAAKDRGKGIYLIATDGHRMGILYDAEGAIVGDRGLGAIMKVTPGLLAACRTSSKGLPKMLIASGSRVSIAPDFGFEHSDAETYIMPGQPWIDGRFPDWVKVLPVFADLKIGTTSSINVRYIAEFEKVVPRGERSRWGTHITFWQVQPHSTIVVQVHQLPNFVGIVMPVHDMGEPSMRAALKPMFSAKPVTQPKPAEATPA